MSEQINKERLNELLGIQEGQTFDDYIAEAADMGGGKSEEVIDQTAALIAETKAKVDEIDEQFNQNIQTIDNGKKMLQTMPTSDDAGSASERIDTLVNVESAFKSIEDLVDTTKQMIANVYGIISSCDVLDSETVGAAASLIGETRQLIAEYTGLYKQRVKFFDNVKMETLKQQHRIELMERKHELDMEKWNRQHPSVEASAEDVIEGETVQPGQTSFSVNDLLIEMDRKDRESDAEQENEENDE